MAMKCESCGKGVMYGHNVSHAKNRTRKIFKPNLHVGRVVVEGRLVKMKLCTKCLRIYKKVASAKQNIDSTVSTQNTESTQAPVII